MSISRRSFVAGAAALGLGDLRTVTATVTPPQAADRYDPWIEVDRSALRHNVREVARLSAGKPILAVVKNNAYGLGLAMVGRILEPMAEIAGFAVVKTSAALELRASGVRKPILLMGMFADPDGIELVANDITLSLYTDDAPARVGRLASRIGRPVTAHLYLDTGMGRMGMAYHRALPWIGELAARDDLRVTGTYMAFTEVTEFDHEQLDRFNTLVAEARQRGVELGRLHAASSNGVFHLPEARLDMVRPGIALWGGYPSRPEEERQMSTLHPTFRLRARVVRVEQLRPGDGVSYGRRYVAQRPTWVATLPVGHSDGYTGKAVNGARVLIGDRLYPVIGSVSASHSIVEVGDEARVAVGDVATLVGPDHPEITPNGFEETVGESAYNVMMHLNPALPRILQL
jgi:alanine racemase